MYGPYPAGQDTDNPQMERSRQSGSGGGEDEFIPGSGYFKHYCSHSGCRPGALDKSVDDPGVRYTFYLLTQIALASRKDNWQAALAAHGLRVANTHTVFDFTAEVQDAIDRHVRQSPSGATDITEMAQQAAEKRF